LALFVPDLKQAEEYYRDLFEMDVITLEVPQSDGHWYALPTGKDWSDLEKAGISLDTLAWARRGAISSGVDFLHEFPYAARAKFPFMEQGEDRWYRLPPHQHGIIPFLFSLQVRKVG
jgi:catechol 2,3-dioxygenase-like lactoylglutathione lyase family enzyme